MEKDIKIESLFDFTELPVGDQRKIFKKVVKSANEMQKQIVECGEPDDSEIKGQKEGVFGKNHHCLGC